MMSMKEMSYGEAEPVWIVKPDKKDDKEEDKIAKNEEEKGEYSILTAIPYYPYYYPDYVPPAAAKKEDGKPKETKVVLKVPICCGECEESVTVALKGLKGVKSVECETRKEKVTVLATTAAIADILMACRILFKKSRLWSDDD